MEPVSSASAVLSLGSVAFGLVKAVYKLDQFVARIKDVPEDVARSLEDLTHSSAAIELAENNIPKIELDQPSQTVVKHCKTQIANLQEKILKTVEGLESGSIYKRKLAAYKFVRDEDRLKIIGDTIEKAKSTLLLVQLNYTYLEIRLQRREVSELSQFIYLNQEFRQRHHIFKSTQNISMQILEQFSPEVGSMKESLGPNSICSKGNEKERSISSTTPERYPPRPLIKVQPSTVVTKTTLLTPVGRMKILSSVTQRPSMYGRSKEFIDKNISYTICPNRLLQMLGLSYGLVLNAKATTGWQFTINPFRQVPEKSLIFEFCSNGNLSGLQTVLELGHGSLRDRDLRGRTPLWYAIKSLQVDIADFLLREGADIHVRDWEDNEPIMAMENSDWVNPNATSQVALVQLFHRYSHEAMDEAYLRRLIGSALIYYEPSRNSLLTVSERYDAWFQIIKEIMSHFPRDCYNWSRLIMSLIKFNYGTTVVQWAIENVSGYFNEDVMEFEFPLFSALSMQLWERDTRSMRLVFEKTRDIHGLWLSKFPRVGRLETPTSLMMYQRASFLRWKEILLSYNIDLDEFVQKEMEREPLVREGWTEQSLRELFKHTFEDDGELKGIDRHICGRCQASETNTLLVDLQWRSLLRDFRRNHSCHATKIVLDFTDVASSPVLERNLQVKQIFKETALKEMPYRFVCPLVCWVDRTCVAWIADEDDTPHYPPYKEIITLVEEECPTLMMPGAFGD